MKRLTLAVVLLFAPLFQAGAAGEQPSFEVTDPADSENFREIFLALSQALQTSQYKVTAWTSFTPTGSWSSNTTYTGFWRRLGDTMEVDLLVSLSGAPNNVSLTVNIPSGYTIDTAKMVGSGAISVVGVALYFDNAGVDYNGSVIYSSTTSVAAETHSVSGTNVVSNGLGGNTMPFTWGNGDKAYLHFSVPISTWTATE
jgi:hypothetical protein